LQCEAAQWLADRSFSIYLLHPVVIEYCKPIYAYLGMAGSLSGALLYAASMVVTLSILLVLANITFLYIEKPGMDIGKRM
jgi:peptidoglycan/LPS O-acetylase OafA/YrhL